VCAFGTQQEMQEANMLRRWWRVGVRGQMIWLIVLCTVGCQPDKYRDEADEQVYSILDEKWQGDFGSRTDYQLRDNEPNSQEILAGSTQPAQMSLAEAVRMATANNRDYQTQKEQMYLVGLGLTGARHDFEAQPFATLSGGYAKGAADESVGLGGQGGVNLLLASGAQISTSLAVDWLRFLTGDARTSLGSVLAATVRQPLLQGAGRRVVMENLTQAERDTFYAIRSFNRFRKEFVVSVVTDYYRVLQQLDRVANEQNNYRRLQVAAEQTRMLAEAGRLPPVQADQAEQAELDGKNSYVRAQQSYQQVLDAFKLQLSLPTAATIALDPNELAALETTETMPRDRSTWQRMVCCLASIWWPRQTPRARRPPRRPRYASTKAITSWVSMRTSMWTNWTNATPIGRVLSHWPAGDVLTHKRAIRPSLRYARPTATCAKPPTCMLSNR